MPVFRLSMSFPSPPFRVREAKIGSGWNRYHGKALLEATCHYLYDRHAGGEFERVLCLVHTIFEIADEIADGCLIKRHPPFPLTPYTPPRMKRVCLIYIALFCTRIQIIFVCHLHRSSLSFFRQWCAVSSRNATLPSRATFIIKS